MKVLFRVLGVLLILAIGLSFVFYGKSNKVPADAEKAYSCGDYETAEQLYEKGIGDLGKWSFSKIKFFQEDIHGITLARAWSFYYQGYYDSGKYELAEEIVSQELKKEKSIYKDQLYNLQALICWQKGVDLFIKLDKKALYSKKINQFLEGAKANSGEAVKANDGKDWGIKYNYEFFRQDPKKLKKSMQQAAKQKKKDKEKKEKLAQKAKEKQIKSNQKKQTEGQQGKKAEGKKMDKDKKKGEKKIGKVLVPTDEKSKEKSEDTSGSNKKKKKKKG